MSFGSLPSESSSTPRPESRDAQNLVAARTIEIDSPRKTFAAKSSLCTVEGWRGTRADCLLRSWRGGRRENGCTH